jgi:hypothetical protein
MAALGPGLSVVPSFEGLLCVTSASSAPLRFILLDRNLPQRRRGRRGYAEIELGHCSINNKGRPRRAAPTKTQVKH